jgi:hypothetical protein
MSPRHLPVVCAAVLLAVSLSPPEASALPPLSLRLGYASQVSTARAYDLVDDNDHLPLFRLGVGYAFPMQGARLEVEGGFLSGGTSAPLFQFDRAKLGLVGVEVGAAYRLRLGTYAEPYAQALVGYDRLSLDMGPLGQRVGQVSATALLGVSLVFPLNSYSAKAPSFLIDLGVGYGFRPTARFDALAPRPPGEDEEEPIPSQTLRAGDLPLAGMAYRLQVGLRL